MYVNRLHISVAYNRHFQARPPFVVAPKGSAAGAALVDERGSLAVPSVFVVAGGLLNEVLASCAAVLALVSPAITAGGGGAGALGTVTRSTFDSDVSFFVSGGVVVMRSIDV